MKDMTKGYPAKIIVFFTIPVILGAIFQQLYNLTDSKLVSLYVDSAALAAVGATSVVSDTIISFANGLTQGYAILVARYFGAKDDKQMRKSFAGTVILTLSIAITLTVLAQILIPYILVWTKTPSDIYDSSLSYVRIILCGVIFTAIYNMCANTLRAVGDSKTPLICLIISVFINVFLDFWMISGLKLGIRGAAIATVTSQLLSCIFCLIFLFKKYKILIPHSDEWRVDTKLMKNLFASGISMGLMVCIVNIGTVILQSSINGLGTIYVTTHTAVRRVFGIMTLFMYTFGTTMTTFVSQNLGAGEKKRIVQGIRHALVIVFCSATIMIVLVRLLGESVLAWLASTNDETIISNGYMYLRISSMFFYVLGPLFVFRCSLQGLGQKIIPLVSSGIELSMKLVFAWVFVPVLGYLGVSITEPVSWVVMTIPLMIVYFIEKKKLLS